MRPAGAASTLEGPWTITRLAIGLDQKMKETRFFLQNSQQESFRYLDLTFSRAVDLFTLMMTHLRSNKDPYTTKRKRNQSKTVPPCPCKQCQPFRWWLCCCSWSYLHLTHGGWALLR